MKKIKIISILAVAMAVTISVGLTSCSKDKTTTVEVDKLSLIQGRWYNHLQGYRIEFRKDLTYYYENSIVGKGEGNYKLLESIEDYELRFSSGDVFNTTLFKLLASGSFFDFDQIWVYYRSSNQHIVVEFYAGDELLPDDKKFYTPASYWE